MSLTATMSRPLDQIKTEHRVADKYVKKHGRHRSNTDTIDVLDESTSNGVPYHHDGPYEATLAAANTGKRYAPIEAVKEGNKAALKATPREYIQDSLRKHVPLQGVAIVPPGQRSMSGQVMQYEEGADLMREKDAEGGAYRRYDFMTYKDQDLKGKGEPSYTLEERRKRQEAQGHRQRASLDERSRRSSVEMQPMLPRDLKDHGATVRARSVSAAGTNAQASGSSSSTMSGVYGTGSVRRSSSTRERVAEGLKKRIGSMRHRPQAEA